MARRNPCSVVRHRDQVNVVRHQAIRPNRHTFVTALLGDEFHISRVVFVTKERLLPPVPTLRNVVRQTRNNHSRQSSHAQNLHEVTQFVNMSIVSPDFRKDSCRSQYRRSE